MIRTGWLVNGFTFSFLLLTACEHPHAYPDSGDPLQVVGQWPGQGEAEVEKARKHILWMESRGNYAAVDPRNRWFGAYQFHIRTSDLAARRMNRSDLVGVPASQWSQKDQDAAFYVIFDRGRGKRHWAGPMRRYKKQ